MIKKFGELCPHYMAETTSSTLGRKPTAGPDPAIMINYMMVDNDGGVDSVIITTCESKRS